MPTEVVFRKLGNSTGLVFPPAVLRDLGLRPGSCMSLETGADGSIILRPKRRYTLAELVAQCDLNAPVPDGMQHPPWGRRCGDVHHL